MADFDTFAKRFSGMNLVAAGMIMMPNPDGAIAQGDRQHFIRLYSGIAAAGATTAHGIPLVNAGLVNRGLVNAGLVN